jgi:tetratricopeptide (TPR) repeat protein
VKKAVKFAALSLTGGLVLSASQISPVEVRNLIEQRQLARAEDLVVRHIASAGRSPEWILLLAEIRLDQQRHQESLQLLDGSRRLGDSSAQNQLLAGLNYVALNRLDLAERELRAASQNDPRNPRAFYYLGRLLYTRNLFDEAIETTRKAIDLDPDFIRSWDNLGLCYEAIQKDAEAEKAYMTGITKQRISGSAVEWPALNLGILLLRRGDAVRAKEYFQEALKINANSAEAHFRLGSVFEREANLNAALEQYRKAVECDPKLAKAFYRSALIYRKLGKEAEAKEKFRAYQQASPEK